MPENPKFVDFLCMVLPVSPEHQPALEALATVASEQLYKSGEYVFFEGEKGTRGFYLLHGRVALRKTSPSGKELIVALLGPGEPFGTLAALDGRAFPLSAQAQTASTVLEFPIEAFARLLQSDPAISRALMEMLGSRLRASHELSRALAHDKVEIRVAAALLSLRPRFRGEDPNDIMISRQELADAVGITIETATRTMKQFEQEGIVDLSIYGRVRLLRADRLLSVVDSAE